MLLQSGRMCVAVPGGDKPPKGVLLGSSAGGGVLYLEPPAAVPLNNELAAARGEAYAAEEAVLWKLTGSIVDAEDDIRLALDVVCTFPRIGAVCRNTESSETQHLRYQKAIDCVAPQPDCLWYHSALGRECVHHTAVSAIICIEQL